jgi:hypothetical protein
MLVSGGISGLKARLENYKMQFVFGILLMAQLTLPPGVALPQVMSASFTPVSVVKAGQKADIAVSFSVNKPYVINRTPQITLKLIETPGVKLAKMDLVASPDDPKSKDEYYVDLPKLHVVATAAKPGKYEIPGKLTYFFCNKSDGFCSKQTVDVKVPLQVQ